MARTPCSTLSSYPLGPKKLMLSSDRALGRGQIGEHGRPGPPATSQWRRRPLFLDRSGSSPRPSSSQDLLVLEERPWPRDRVAAQASPRAACLVRRRRRPGRRPSPYSLAAGVSALVRASLFWRWSLVAVLGPVEALLGDLASISSRVAAPFPTFGGCPPWPPAAARFGPSRRRWSGPARRSGRPRFEVRRLVPDGPEPVPLVEQDLVGQGMVALAGHPLGDLHHAGCRPRPACSSRRYPLLTFWSARRRREDLRGGLPLGAQLGRHGPSSSGDVMSALLVCELSALLPGCSACAQPAGHGVEGRGDWRWAKGLSPTASIPA